MGNPIGINEALQALENLFDFCEEIDLHLPDEEKTGYQMLPDYLLVNQYIKDNERKHGHWMDGGRNYNTWWHKCSCCYANFTDLRVMTYCPACGAKMDGKFD